MAERRWIGSSLDKNSRVGSVERGPWPPEKIPRQVVFKHEQQRSCVTYAVCVSSAAVLLVMSLVVGSPDSCVGVFYDNPANIKYKNGLILDSTPHPPQKSSDFIYERFVAARDALGFTSTKDALY